MCVCIYYYSLIQKLTEVLIDILNTNIKSFRVTKYKLFIFMATTQLESGSVMVGMDCDCKSASMNKPLCDHVWEALPSPLKGKKKEIPIQLPHPWKLKLNVWYIHLFLTLLSTLILLNSRENKQLRMCHIFSCYLQFLCCATHWRLTLCSEGIEQHLTPSVNQMPQRQIRVTQLVSTKQWDYGGIKMLQNYVLFFHFLFVFLVFSSLWLHRYALTATVP